MTARVDLTDELMASLKEGGEILAGSRSQPGSGRRRPPSTSRRSEDVAALARSRLPAVTALVRMLFAIGSRGGVGRSRLPERCCS